MIAGGLGNVSAHQVHKEQVAPGDLIVQIGGPGLLIGVGGGAASSLGQGANDEALDFNSVQRENPEMQRRCQEVINRCHGLGKDNPIRSIHDVGAGGLSNAVPELVEGAGLGARIHLCDIPVDDPSMSPLQIWCNEAQERYVLVIAACDRRTELVRIAWPSACAARRGDEDEGRQSHSILGEFGLIRRYVT